MGRYVYLDLTEVQEYIADRGYTINEQVLKNAVKFAPRFQSWSGYTVQAPSEIVDQVTGYPVINDRFDGVLIGWFTDIAPWDGQRHKWNVYINGTPGASIVGLNASLYQLFIRDVEQEKGN